MFINQYYDYYYICSNLYLFSYFLKCLCNVYAYNDKKRGKTNIKLYFILKRNKILDQTN